MDAALVNRNASIQRTVCRSCASPLILAPVSIEIPDQPLLFPQFSDPLVSIIIPTFNQAALLLTCLRSILQFTSIPYEVIVVNDASTDATGRLLEYVKNIRVVNNQENMDFLRSVNKGAALSSAKYLLF